MPLAIPACDDVSQIEIVHGLRTDLHGLLWHATILSELRIVHARIEGILDHHILWRHIGHPWPRIRHHAAVELLTFKSWSLGRRPTVFALCRRRGATVHVYIALLSLHLLLLLLLQHLSLLELLQLLRSPAQSMSAFGGQESRLSSEGVCLHLVGHLSGHIAIHHVISAQVGLHEAVGSHHAWPSKVLILLVLSHSLHILQHVSIEMSHDEKQ